MPDKTGIEYVDATWNITTGCDPISAGCLHCWAGRLAKGRLRGRFGYPKLAPFRVTLRPGRLSDPTHWRKPRRIFVSAMGDLFHGAVDFRYITHMYAVAENTPRHTYLVLTKRPCQRRRFHEWVKRYQIGVSLPLPNVWEGVTVENAGSLPRIDELRQTPAAVRFVSLEPLLGPLAGLDLAGIDWVIVGGETGAGARPMRPDWARSIRGQCQRAGVPLFFKAWGEWAPTGPDSARQAFISHDGRCWPASRATEIGSMSMDRGQVMYRVGRRLAGRLLDGVEHNEYPRAIAEAAEEK